MFGSDDFDLSRSSSGEQWVQGTEEIRRVSNGSRGCSSINSARRLVAEQGAE